MLLRHVDNTHKSVPLSSLSRGAVFGFPHSLRSYAYMVIQRRDEITAINLDGGLCSFPPDTLVIPYPNAVCDLGAPQYVE